MALHVDILAEGLVNLLNGGSQTLEQAILRGPVMPLVRAYDRYAKEAQDLGFNPTMMTGTICMQGALHGAISQREPVPETLGRRLQEAHRAYWEATTFATSFKPMSPEAQVMGGNGRFRSIVLTRVHVGDTTFFFEEVARIFGEEHLAESDRAVALAQAWHRATGHVWTEMSGFDTAWPQDKAQAVRAWGCIR